MSEAQLPQAEFLPPAEALTDEQLGGLLAAVGNHEAKAVVLGSMQNGVAYNMSALHDLFIEAQGDAVSIKGGVANQIAYCKDSFYPVGAVAKVRYGENLRFELTESGETYGKALAGHVLDLSLRYPDTSLRQLFGMTHTSKTSREPRSPVQRVQLFRLLPTMDEPIRVAQIERILGVTGDVLSNQLKWLDKAGLITHQSGHSEDIATKIEFLIPQDFGGAGAKSVGRKTVDGILRELASGADTVVTYDEIVKAVYGRNQKIGRSAISRYLRELEVSGRIIKNELDGNNRSVIYLKTETRTLFTEVVDIYDLALSDAPTFIKMGKAKLAQVLSNPADVRRLIAKAYSNSPEANGVPREIRFAKIAAFLTQNAAATTGELAEALRGSGITERSVVDSLQQMRHLKLTQSIRIGRHAVWALADKDE